MSAWYENPRMVDAVCWDLILSDYPRGLKRARIQNLANGAPPYSQQEVEENAINVNISDLTHTRLLHDARSQYASGLLKTGYFATAQTDAGPVHKRQERSAVVTKLWNRPIKESIQYYERLRAECGMLVVHGISPGIWENEDAWCSVPIGVEDVLLPGETLLGFRNLPFMVFRRSYTGIELKKLTQKEKRDPGWNMPFIGRILDWMEDQATQLRSLNWPDVWAPEKIEERRKSEAGGTLAGDRAPKIDVFDIYVYDDSHGKEGWLRRIILDSWTDPQITGGSVSYSRKPGVIGDTNNFLFTSKNRKAASNWQQIASFSFADLSAIFPARYHSIRALGWMLYAACHLGNRMRCKFYESVLESLMQLYEVDSAADVQNALKVNLVNHGFIDKTIRPVKASDRWQVNANLVELGLQDNSRVISENAASYIQSKNYSQTDTEKTRFQVAAELQASQALVSAALNQAYQYRTFELREIFRRFCKPNSSDLDVRVFRAGCIKAGVPEYMLNDPTAWQIESEKIMGAGNKTVEMLIADWMMQNRGAFDPEPQRDILRRATLAYTDDPALSLRLVPDEPPTVTRNVREAEHIASDLMNNIGPIEPMTGENHLEIIETLLRILTKKVDRGAQQGGMVSAQELAGLQAIAEHIGTRIQLLDEDEQQKQRAKQYADLLANLGNHIKAFAQRLQQAMQAQMKAQQQGNGQQGPDPKVMAKVQEIKATGDMKRQVATQAAAQRTAQRQVQHELKLKQQMQQHQADLSATDLEAASSIRRNRLTATEE